MLSINNAAKCLSDGQGRTYYTFPVGAGDRTVSTVPVGAEYPGFYPFINQPLKLSSNRSFGVPLRHGG